MAWLFRRDVPSRRRRRSGPAVSRPPLPARAREQLRPAAATFERLGARPWADRAHAELAATGETLRRRAPGAAEQLTPQELQIALLLTAGRTTREAAAALFLSPKTVEYHLRHVYAKLGLHSRDELARLLAAQPAAGRGGDGDGGAAGPGGQRRPADGRP